MSKLDLSKNYMAPPPAGNPRRTEAWALTQAANRMKASRDADDPEAMLAAARLNWRLWTIIQSELLDPMSTVPAEVRVNVLSLSRFVDATTVDFVTDPRAAKLDSLIAINRELAGGLYTNPEPTNAGADSGGAADGEGARDATPSRRPAAASVRLTI